LIYFPLLLNRGNSGKLLGNSGKSGKSGMSMLGKSDGPRAIVGWALGSDEVDADAVAEADAADELGPFPAHLQVAKASAVALATAGLMSSAKAVASALVLGPETAASALAAALAKASEMAAADDSALAPHASATAFE
jgi:hypothetical protein